MIKLCDIDTERENPRTREIDRASTIDMVRMINAEDHLVADAVEKTLPEVARAIDLIVERMKKGGRLIYCGCGTSGRLGALDAAECPPTYGVDASLVVGLMGGGAGAFVKAAEGAEDNDAQGRADLQGIGFSAGDALVGIAASGRTPYVLGAMDYAASLGAPVIALCSCRDAEMTKKAMVSIVPLTGPEVVTGSTRMKSGTAQKMVLNMLSTGVMIKLGKVYGNLMVDVKPSNEKLCERAVAIVTKATGAEDGLVRKTLKECHFSCKTAIVMLLDGVSKAEAEKALEKAEGHIARALGQH